MKKIAGIALSMIMAFALVSCGGTTKTVDESAAAPAESTAGATAAAAPRLVTAKALAVAAA